MFFADGWWFPDGEKHLIEWMNHPKNRDSLNGRLAYQGKKQVAAMHLCKSFRVAVDVGGHVGLWAYNLARRFGVVHVFEPVAAHRECFEKNVDVPNVQLYPRALGAQSGMISIHTAPTSSGDSWVEGHGNIQMDKLDDHFLQDVDFIKIDCEGYELNVLRGAEQTLRLCKPVMVVEQKPGHAQRFGFGEKDAVPYLQGLGAKVRLEMSGDFFMSWD